MSHHRLSAVIGHRGVPALAPENSLAGLRLASELGYAWCEIDTQSSVDGIAVVHHDSRLKGGDRQLVSRSTHEELAAASIGLNRHGESQFVPTLAECLTVANECGLGLVVEIKTRRGRVVADVDAAVEAIRGCSLPRLMVSSFSVAALERFIGVMPEIPVALNVGRIRRGFFKHVSNVHFDVAHASERGVRCVVDMGYGAYSYTVNDPRTRDKLASMGAHGVFTDVPTLL